jgi:hypothetical protein
LAGLWREPAASITEGLWRGLQMATFNRIFTTHRLVQIIVVLGATVLMKLIA